MTGPDRHPVHQAYAEALAHGGDTVIPLGRDVLCDGCNTDMTDDPRSGGFMFGSYAIGPCCAERRLASIKSYGEEDHIGVRCPDGVSFADWIRYLRGPDAAITIVRQP